MKALATAVLVFLCSSALELVSANELQDVKTLSSSLWRPGLPRCVDSQGKPFPSKVRADGSCDDRDSVIFNGLLCASGEDEACHAVVNSQDKATTYPERGAWWRSPRIALDPTIPRSDSFSPDQNLGVILTVVTKRTDASYKARLGEWIQWINVNRPCVLGGEPLCIRGWPRLCRDDTEKGCTMRPGDIAMMQTVMSRLKMPIPEGPFMRELFANFNEFATPLLLVDAHVNRLGYPMHLVATGIMIMRSFNTQDANPILQEAGKTLYKRQSENAFFAYLAGAPKIEVAKKVLAVCPKTAAEIPTEKTEWIWEREQGGDAPKRTMLWDCLFMANLLAMPD